MRHHSLLAAGLVLFGTSSLVVLLRTHGNTFESDKNHDQSAKRIHVFTDPNDWPTYNRDLAGTRHNTGEKTLGPKNVGKLVEKWRFPATGSNKTIGIVNSLVAVGGSVYFGTATFPTVYKLKPDGTMMWSYNTPPRKVKSRSGFGLPPAGFMNAPLVTNRTVFIGDIGGRIYALDEKTGKERWRVDTRAMPFPGAHDSNCIFSAPILAEGKLIVAGGGFEHGVGANPAHDCCTGRGFVAALDPETGKVVWKYDVGPEPKKLNPPVKIKDAYGTHVFKYGPSTSSVWSTPSYEPTTRMIFFGTDCHNSPRQPTKDNPKLYTKHSCAVIAVDVHTGKEKWVTQVNPGDVWNYSLRGYDPKTGLYKDQSIGDTPKPYWIMWKDRRRLVVGVGCKNGVFYVIDALTGEILYHTPPYTGSPNRPVKNVNPRTLALPSVMGGLQTGCATDGKAIYTNGTDILGLAANIDSSKNLIPPTGGRVVSLSLDTQRENWRHERPKVKAVGGTPKNPAFTNVGDPVASGVAIANGVLYFTTTVSNKLVALDTKNGKVLKEIKLGPAWCGPVVSRGHVYVGTGNLLFSPFDPREAYFPKKYTGEVISFGLPGKSK
ncbi:MAG: PQQ-binding-like beta-propeller repeat protein [Gemmataceae bacterium]